MAKDSHNAVAKIGAMPIEFCREPLTARFRSPDGSKEVERRLEVRFDPLLGTSARIAEGVSLPKADPSALAFVPTDDPACPFCPQRLARITPCILSAICAEGRIREGETILFPNVVPYSQHAAVAILSTRHWLALREFTPGLIADNLAAALRFVREVHHLDRRAQHCAYNVNYLYPSGGSLPHPHAQIYLDSYPTTMMRLQCEAGERYWSQHGRSFWDALVEAEEQRSERFVGRIGATSWMTAFAPLGFNEVRAVVSQRETLLDLTDEERGALALGISRVLAWYEASGYNSFNLALYSGPLSGAPGFRVNLTMVTRSALIPNYRSDATHLERLHWEAAVDRPPEALAAELGEHFAAA
jgi:UDPglucose--hexose-1-phosphate uridylyltransferase